MCRVCRSKKPGDPKLRCEVKVHVTDFGGMDDTDQTLHNKYSTGTVHHVRMFAMTFK